MGLNKLSGIMEKFREEGRGSTPVAIIQNGTLPTQRVITGKVASIVALARVADMNSPSVIVVGEVVNYLHALNAITQEVIVHYQ